MCNMADDDKWRKRKIQKRIEIGNLGSIPGLGIFPWRREWQPTPVFLPGESHVQRSLVGYSPWGHKEQDIAELLSTREDHRQVITQIRVAQKTCNRYYLSKGPKEVSYAAMQIRVMQKSRGKSMSGVFEKLHGSNQLLWHKRWRKVVRDAVHRLRRTAFCPALCIVVKRFTFTLRRESLEQRGGMIVLAAGRR